MQRLECRQRTNSYVWIQHMACKFPGFFNKPPTLYRYWETIIYFKWQKQGSLSSFGLLQDGACTDLVENLSVNSLKGDLSNNTTRNPPQFSLVNTFNPIDIKISEFKRKCPSLHFDTIDWVSKIYLHRKIFWEFSASHCNSQLLIDKNRNTMGI